MKRLHVIGLMCSVASLAGAVMTTGAVGNASGASANPGPGYAAVGTIPQSQARFTIRRLEGDVTGDCMVKIDDMQQIANRYLTARGSLLYSPLYDVNLPAPDGIIDVQDLQFVFGRMGSTCAQPIPPQPPVELPAQPGPADITLTKSPNTANIWICNPGTGACGADVPSRIDAQNWQNGIVIDEVMTVNVQAPIAAYGFEFRYDPSVFLHPNIVDQHVLDADGARTSSCTQNESIAGDILFSCTSSGPPGSEAQWAGPRVMAKITLTLQSHAASNLRPAKENGLVTDVFDTGAYATQPGQTPTPTPSAGTPTQTPAPASATPTSAPCTGGGCPTPTPCTSVFCYTPTPCTGLLCPTATPTSTRCTGAHCTTPTEISTVLSGERPGRPPTGLPRTGNGARPSRRGTGVVVGAFIFSAFALGHWVRTRRRSGPGETARAGP